jgi:hypothetical protein
MKERKSSNEVSRLLAGERAKADPLRVLCIFIFALGVYIRTLVRVTHALNIAAGYTHACTHAHTQIIFSKRSRNKLIFKHLAPRERWRAGRERHWFKKTCSLFVCSPFSMLLGLSRFLPRASLSRREKGGWRDEGIIHLRLREA